MDSQKQTWDKKQHESKVENFYGKGVENYGEFHGGYLNFGLWEPNNQIPYVKAAENLVIHIGQLLKLNKKSYLLDVACGMGPQTILLHKKFGSKIHAIDVTYKHVQRTQERINENNLNAQIKVTHATATKLPFEDNTFTHVNSIEGPEHFDTREQFFKEAFRVLKPGGVMALADYTLKHNPNKLWEKALVELARHLWHVPKENRDTIERYKMKLEKTGFANITFEEIGEKVIPGYFFEQAKPEIKKELHKIRGWFATYPGHLIDWAVYKAHQKGLIDYIFVRAEKPRQSSH
jgi:microcystin synthetase protein McyJ